MAYLTTSDGTKIVYDYYPAVGSTSSPQEKPRGYLLLIHMMPATKESWRGFAGEMQKEGFASLAIDLRGHGESAGGPSGYKNFSDAEHQKSILDVEAGVEFLKKQGAPPEKITLMGASIGANLALWYLAGHPEIKNGIFLSAGLNYRGIETLPLAKKLHPGRRTLFFTAKDDVRAGGDNPSMNKRILEAVPARVGKELVVFERGGHGTDFLEQTSQKIKEFLASVL